MIGIGDGAPGEMGTESMGTYPDPAGLLYLHTDLVIRDILLFEHLCQLRMLKFVIHSMPNIMHNSGNVKRKKNILGVDKSTKRVYIKTGT